MNAAGFRQWFQPVPEDPFYQPRTPLWLPAEMAAPPRLEASPTRRRAERRFALLVNPFYPKSPHGSFGKHVLTPSLALTSIAGATPAQWRVQYWDENLLQGRPGPTRRLRWWGLPFISPSLSAPTPWPGGIGSAEARWCWAACTSNPARKMRPRMRTLSPLETVCSFGRAFSMTRRRARLSRVTGRVMRHPFNLDPVPRRDLLSRDSYLTTTSSIATRGCHNRCGFCYLATDGLHVPYRMRDPEDIRRQLEADGQPYAVFIDNNLAPGRNTCAHSAWRCAR